MSLDGFHCFTCMPKDLTRFGLKACVTNQLLPAAANPKLPVEKGMNRPTEAVQPSTKSGGNSVLGYLAKVTAGRGHRSSNER